jgi:hypothetical protein
MGAAVVGTQTGGPKGWDYTLKGANSDHHLVKPGALVALVSPGSL